MIRFNRYVVVYNLDTLHSIHAFDRKNSEKYSFKFNRKAVKFWSKQADKQLIILVMCILQMYCSWLLGDTTFITLLEVFFP